jgi:hypothetical protein
MLVSQIIQLNKDETTLILKANQKVLAISKHSISNSDRFICTNKEVIFQASKQLNNGEFKLWVYLSSQTDTKGKYNWLLSCNDVCQSMGITKNTFHSSVNGLIDKGYLINKEGNKYMFKENICVPKVGIDNNTIYSKAYIHKLNENQRKDLRECYKPYNEIKPLRILDYKPLYSIFNMYRLDSDRIMDIHIDCDYKALIICWRENIKEYYQENFEYDMQYVIDRYNGIDREYKPIDEWLFDASIEF